MPTSRIVHDLTTLSADSWQSLDYGNNPFLSYPFLAGLEQYQCLQNQYWQAHHIVIEEGATLLGILPLYIKQDSYGEFVFDWAWADAYERAGRQYYPKLVSAIPFTPVAGDRLLVNKNADKNLIQQQLLQAAMALMQTHSFSSLHVLFPNHATMDFLTSAQGLQRLTCQYHWFNQSYRDFKDFMDSLTAKKRKKIKQERRGIENAGIEIERLDGNQISPEQWQDFYQFYCITFYKKWGEPRLTLEFFQAIGKALPTQTLLILAKKAGQTIAAAFAMNDGQTLYGRHWGCKETIAFLHFELCYYQTIEHAIAHGLQKLDVGVQGEHKLARGFYPVLMPSAHFIREPDFGNVIADYLEREAVVLQDHIAMLKTHLPYKTPQSY